MVAHGGARRLLDSLGIADALLAPLGHRPAFRQIAVDRIMRGGLVGHHVRPHAAAEEFRHDLGRVAEQADRLRLASLRPALDLLQRLVERVGALVEIAGAQAEIDRVRVAFDGEAAGAGHHGRQRLRAAHAAEPGGQDPLALEIAVIVLAARLDEGLVGALHDALRADVDPRAGRHLAVHHQALAIELVELVPGRPVRHEVGIGDQHARRVGMGAEHADRLARLDEQRLVVGKRLQRADDAVEIVPGPRRPADAAIDDQLVRILGDVRVEIVHQHAQRRLGLPGARVERRAARAADFADVVAGVTHDHCPLLVMCACVRPPLSAIQTMLVPAASMVMA